MYFTFRKLILATYIDRSYFCFFFLLYYCYIFREYSFFSLEYSQ